MDADCTCAIERAHTIITHNMVDLWTLIELIVVNCIGWNVSLEIYLSNFSFVVSTYVHVCMYVWHALSSTSSVVLGWKRPKESRKKEKMKK